MIQTILQALDQAAAEHLPVGARYLLVEQQRTGTGVAPHRYDGSGRWTPIANDNAGTFSYWRLTSPIKEQEVDAAGCYDVFEAVYSLRLVAMVDRSLCPDLIDVARGAATAVRGTDDGIRASLKLRTVDFGVSSVEVNSQRVYTQEFGGTLDVNPDKALVSIDIAVTITGKSICFAPCEGTADYLCGLIEAQTWQRIKGCMTEAQIAAATADLCEDAPCDPLNIGINGEDAVITVTDPCGQNVAIAVTQGGSEVGTWNGTEWVVPECPTCDPLTYTLENTAEEILSSGEVVDPCGENLLLVAPDATVTFDGLDLVTVPSGNIVNIDCGTNIESAHVTLGGSAENGIYYISGTAGGKTRYAKDANHAFEYSGTRWVLIRPGSDHQAALGNETYPWLADWTGTGIAVDEGTISQYCGGNVEPCADLTITVNDDAYTTVANPCGATADVDVHDSNGNPVGSLVGGVWVVAPPANVLHEYTTGGTWSKPTSASFKGVWVFAAGAGGSGGAGFINNSNITGGSGGGGGSLVRVWIPAASLGATETYAIGAGAAGPASGNGSAGGATLFGLHVEAKGGNGGLQASIPISTVTGGAGGNANLNVPTVNGSSISGGAGGTGARISGLASNGTTGVIAFAAPGGGGGVGVSSGASGGNGRYGGGVWSTTETFGGAGGISPGGNGTAGVSDIYLNPFLGLPVTPTIGIGTGGGGGAGATTANAGAGAAGGRAAGGGGGGSCYQTPAGFIRGAGGDGGNGFLIVYEVYEI